MKRGKPPKKTILQARKTFDMNLGTQTHKTPKDYNRKDNKIDIREIDIERE